MITLTNQDTVDLLEVLNLARLELMEARNDGVVLTSGAIEGVEACLEMIEDKLYNNEEENNDNFNELYPD